MVPGLLSLVGSFPSCSLRLDFPELSFGERFIYPNITRVQFSSKKFSLLYPYSLIKLILRKISCFQNWFYYLFREKKEHFIPMGKGVIYMEIFLTGITPWLRGYLRTSLNGKHTCKTNKRWNCPAWATLSWKCLEGWKAWNPHVERHILQCCLSPGRFIYS